MIRKNLANQNGKTVFKLAWKRAKALQCIPKYGFSPAEKSKILAIYISAQKLNLDTNKRKRRVEVDHIIPLNNDLICGLHVAANLQIITKRRNAFKGNRFATYIEKNGRKKYQNVSGTPYFRMKFKKSPQKLAKTTLKRRSRPKAKKK